MGKEEIEKIIDMFIKNDEEAIYTYLGVTKEVTEKEFDEKLRELMQKINDEGLEYLNSIISENSENNEEKRIGSLYFSLYLPDDKKKEILKGILKAKEWDSELNIELFEILEAVGDLKYVKEIIENNEKYKFSGYEFIELLELALKLERESSEKELPETEEDIVSYIDEIILNKQKEENKIEGRNIVKLIETINAPEYTKRCIEEREKYGLDSWSVVDLIKTINDPDYTKTCIEAREKYGLDSGNVAELIETINDPDYTKRCIEAREKYGLDSWRVVDLIKTINDPDYIKRCIEEREKYGLDSWRVAELIKTINDPDYTKRCIEEREKYGFDSWRVVDLIEAINDPDYIKRCIERREELGIDGENIVELIKTIKDIEYTKECIERGKELRLNSWNIVELIKTIKDIEYTKECIKERKKYRLDDETIIALIREINDPELTRECIEQREEYGLDGKTVIKLIEGTNNPEYIKECIGKRGEYGFNSDDIAELVVALLKNENADFEFGGIDGKKLLEIFKIEDISFYYKDNIIENIVLPNMDGEEIDTKKANEEIEKVYNILLTNKLPYNFKLFELFRNHENYGEKNHNFYNESDNRDDVIERDLFTVALDSNNRQMRRFLEILYNGEKALERRKKGDQLEDIDEAILLEYRDVLYDFLDVVQSNTITKGTDIDKDFDKLRECLELKEDEDMGEVLLEKYCDRIGFKYERSEDKSIALSLLEYMDSKRDKAKEENLLPFKLEEGDLIKGTDIIYISDFLDRGIRSKEFWRKRQYKK